MTATTPTGRPVSLIAGLYYYHSRGWNPYFRTYFGTPPGGTVTTSFTNNVVTDAYAAFGELTWSPSARLHVIGGARYTSESKDAEFRFLVRAAGLAGAADHRTFRKATFRGVAQYDVADETRIYVSVSNGFKSGVFNAYAFPLVSVDPETITAYELGAKSRFAGLTGTVAAFFYDYRNIQVQAQSPIGGVFVVTLTNAAAARIHGVEASLSGRLGTHLSFDLSGSWMPLARYTDYARAQVFVPQASGNASVVPFDASGSRTVRSPEFQGNLRLGYDTPLAKGRLSTFLSYSYNSGFYFQPGNYSRQRGYHVLNTRLAWTEPSGRYTFSTSGENLTSARVVGQFENGAAIGQSSCDKGT